MASKKKEKSMDPEEEQMQAEKMGFVESVVKRVKDVVSPEPETPAEKSADLCVNDGCNNPKAPLQNVCEAHINRG